jgi:hypothetical protein
MNPISRRDLVARFGLAGMVCWPILKASRANAQAMPSRKFVQIFKGMGFLEPQTRFYPGATGPLTAQVMNSNPLLKALAPVANDITIVGGLDYLRESGNPHGMGQSVVFTGALASIPPSGRAVDYTPPKGPSLDQVIANRFYAQKPTIRKSLVLAINPNNNGLLGRISFPSAGQAITPLTKPSEMYDAVVRDILASCGRPTMGRPDAGVAQNVSVLDLSLQEVNSAISGLSMGAEEKAKLEAFRDAIREIEVASSGIGGSDPRGVDGGVAPCPTMVTAPGDVAAFDVRTKFALDVMALALYWGVTRVTSLLWAGGQNSQTFPFLSHNGRPITDGHHALTHFFDPEVGLAPATAKEKLVLIDTWYMSQVAYFVQKCKMYTEAQGTTLSDNMAMVVGSEVRDGSTHSHTDVPFLIAGKAGGGIRSGRYLRAGSGSNSHNNLLVALAQAMGLSDVTQFGVASRNNGSVSLL